MAIKNYFVEKIAPIAKSFYEYFLEIIKQFGNAIALVIINHFTMQEIVITYQCLHANKLNSNRNLNFR